MFPHALFGLQCLYNNNGDYKQCDDHMQDYMECLHHKKEVRLCALHVFWWPLVPQAARAAWA